MAASFISGSSECQDNVFDPKSDAKGVLFAHAPSKQIIKTEIFVDQPRSHPGHLYPLMLHMKVTTLPEQCQVQFIFPWEIEVSGSA